MELKAREGAYVTNAPKSRRRRERARKKKRAAEEAKTTASLPPPAAKRPRGSVALMMPASSSVKPLKPSVGAGNIGEPSKPSPAIGSLKDAAQMVKGCKIERVFHYAGSKLTTYSETFTAQSDSESSS